LLSLHVIALPGEDAGEDGFGETVDGHSAAVDEGEEGGGEGVVDGFAGVGGEYCEGDGGEVSEVRGFEGGYGAAAEAFVLERGGSGGSGRVGCYVVGCGSCGRVGGALLYRNDVVLDKEG